MFAVRLRRLSVVELPLVFRCDPTIVAGIELRAQNTIVRNSWRADLDLIRQELSRDKHAR